MRKALRLVLERIADRIEYGRYTSLVRKLDNWNIPRGVNYEELNGYRRALADVRSYLTKGKL